MDKFYYYYLEAKKSTYDELESILGRITHLAVPTQKILHFLSRLRSLVDREKNRRMVGIPPQVLQDFKLFQIFITNTNKGINMNLCTYRCPTIAYRADACPQGLGGFSHRGRVWRFRIPTHLHFRATLSFLEFIASTIGPWIDILENNTTLSIGSSPKPIVPLP